MSARNSFTENDSLWRDRRRGMSLENAKGCNEIMRQFFEISLDESMILAEIEVKQPSTIVMTDSQQINQ